MGHKLTDEEQAKMIARAKMHGAVSAKGKTKYPKRNYKKELFEAGLSGMKRRTPSPEFNLPTKKPTKRNH
jgi:hypothetical protein